MRRVSSTELQNNFGHYLLVAQEQEIIVTRNGKDVAKLSGLSIRRDLMAERAPTPGYGLRKASFEEFLELTKEETLERYEYIDGGEIFLQASPKVGHQFTSFRLANKLGGDFLPVNLAFLLPPPLILPSPVMRGGHQCGAA